MNEEIIKSELQFKAVRSSGAGGQNVNKVASKVELTFDLLNSSGLREGEKRRLLKKLENRLTKDSLLLMQCEESRSQHTNKALVIERLFSVLNEGLIIPKRRIKTKVPRSVIKKRITNNRKLSEKKANRKNPNIE